jgi:hypothetical protein
VDLRQYHKQEKNSQQIRHRGKEKSQQEEEQCWKKPKKIYKKKQQILPLAQLTSEREREQQI